MKFHFNDLIHAEVPKVNDTTAYKLHFFLILLTLTFVEATAGSVFGVSCPDSLK